MQTLTDEALYQRLEQAWDEGFEQGAASEAGEDWTANPYSALLPTREGAHSMQGLLIQWPGRVQVQPNANAHWFTVDMVAVGADRVALMLDGEWTEPAPMVTLFTTRVLPAPAPPKGSTHA